MRVAEFARAGIKQVLNRVPLVVGLNRAAKARQTAGQYKASEAHYARRPLSKDHEQLMGEKLAGHRPAALCMPRVFFIGTDEQQDKSGLLQALCKVAQTRWFVKPDGVYGHNDGRSMHLRRRANAELLWSQLTVLSSQQWVPDIVLAQTWGSLIDPVVFSRIRAQWGCMVINMSMDDRHQYWGGRVGAPGFGTHTLIPHIDLALTAAPECVAWYEKENCPALYFPEASDPEIFRPMPDLPKIHDVSFVGARYGIRERLVTALRKAGVTVSAYGTGWEAGRLDNDAVPRLFAQSKILLGVGTIGYCSDFYALKLRDFDGPMSGSFYLTHANPDLDSLFQVGREIMTYNDQNSCVAQVVHFLAHEGEREAIARAGRSRALLEHTWEQRFRGLFLALGFGDEGLDVSAMRQPAAQNVENMGAKK